MIRILEELDAASNALQAALDRYLSACSAIKGCSTQRNTLSCFPRELSRRITEELQLINSYETKIGEAKTAIKISWNSCTDIVPINSLPDEIMGQIFHLILDAQLCAAKGRFQPISLNHIDLCPLVCSRWSWISINSGTLWSHIDLSLNELERYLARAVVYASRAGHGPLDVYISDTPQNSSNPSVVNLASICSFLASIGPRIRSLKLNIYYDLDLYHRVLGECFKSCTPGVLTWLVLTYRPGCRFFESAEDPQMPGSQVIELPKQALEDLWHYITILHLRQWYPPWTSKAYCGLTMLHLTGSAPNNRIPERQLVKILESSPQLRVLRFGLEITDPLPADAPIVPTRLECLEVLSWRSAYPSQLGTFLRLIAPGLNPLRVSINQVQAQESTLLNEMKKLFARSNVTKLSMRAGGNYKLMLTQALLDSLPPLQLLALQYFLIKVPHSTPENNTAELESRSACASSIQTLHLIRCRTRLDALPQIVKGHSVQKLRIWPGDICSKSQHSYRSAGIGEEEINEQLRAICPDAKFLGWSSPAPEDWADT